MISIPTLDSFPYSEDFFRKMRYKIIGRNLTEICLAVSPLLVSYILFSNFLDRLAAVAIILSFSSTYLFWYFLLPRNHALLNEESLYLSRYVLRHENCKHWVHLDIGSFTWDNEIYFDPIHSEGYRVLNAINEEQGYTCSQCGTEGDFDKILINNLNNESY